jgi:hypothetical protein
VLKPTWLSAVGCWGRGLSKTILVTKPSKAIFVIAMLFLSRLGCVLLLRRRIHTSWLLLLLLLLLASTNAG